MVTLGGLQKQTCMPTTLLLHSHSTSRTSYTFTNTACAIIRVPFRRTTCQHCPETGTLVAFAVGGPAHAL